MDIIQFGGLRLDLGKRTLARPGEEIEIKDKEFELLRAILELALETNGAAIPKKEVISKVWPENPRIAPNVIATHLGNLRKRLSDSGQPLIWHKGAYVYVRGEVRRLRQPAADTFFSHTRILGLNHDKVPYVGPVPFPPDRPELFFGRDEEVSQLVDLLTVQKARVVLLFGPSGAGKTSLVNTALSGELRKLDYFVFPVARVGVLSQPAWTSDSTNGYVLSVLRSIQSHETATASNPAVTLEDHLKSGSASGKKGVVLILDQLEEILSPGPYSQKTGFFAELHATLARNSSLCVVLVFREEFLGPLRRLAGELARYWREFVLSELDRSMAAIAIKKPAEGVGVTFEQELVEMLVDELSRGKHVLHNGMIIDEKTNWVEPLHLQLICHALWRRLPEGLVSITFDNVEPILHEADSRLSQLPENSSAETLIANFISFVLQRFCDEAIEGTATRKRAEDEGKIPVELIDLGCLQFITERRTRTPPIGQGMEWTGDLPNWVIEELGRQHMLRAEEHGTERTWELSHDAWIQPVLRRGGRIDTSALRHLYLKIVKQIAERNVATAPRVDEATIHLGCLAFLAGQPDRLSPSLLDALAKEGLFRRMLTGQGVKFELSHPALGLAIAEVRLQGDLEARLTSLKGLSVFVNGALQQHEGSLANWFENHDSVLKTLNWDLAWPFLYESEAEFILRASFATGYELNRWLRQIKNSYPSVTATVLKEAATYARDDCVRRRAAENVAFLGSPESRDLLVALAVSDPEETVRRAAAVGLANPDHMDGWNSIASHGQSHFRRRALGALAWAWESRVRSGREDKFQTWLQGRPRRVRIEAYLERTSIRLRATFSRLAVLCLFASLACGFMTAVTRMVPGRWMGTLSQKAGDFGYHWFNGLIGGMVWGASIPAVLLIWWYVFARTQLWRSKSARLGAAFAAGLGGFLGGLVNTWIMVAALSKEWLHRAGWLPTLESHAVEAFTISRFGFGYIVFGIMFGIGVGCSFYSMLVKSRSIELANDRATPERFEDLPRLIWHSIRRCLVPSRSIAFSMAIATIVFATILHPRDLHVFAFSGDPVRWRIVGEGISVYLGGLGMISGLYFGLVLLKKGISIEGRDEFAIPSDEIDERVD